jgi:tetratricopeptide (TPR) repeat protein
MDVTRRRAAIVAKLGFGLALLAALSCSGGAPSPGQGPPTEQLDTASAAAALFPGAPVEEPLALGFDAAATSQLAEQIDETIGFWAARVERDPRDFVALNELGGLYVRRARLLGDVGDFARAREAFERSLASNRARNLGGLLGLAHVGVYTHQFAEAAELAREALEQRPDEAYAWWVLGDAQLALGQYDEAYRSFTQPAALNGTLPAWSRLAFIEALRGDPTSAALSWELAIGADSGRQPEETAWVHTQAGLFQLEIGRLDEARSELDRALEAVAGYPAALAGRAGLAVSLGQLDEAIRILEQVVARRPLPEEAMLLGELYEATGQPERAAEQYDLVRAIDRLQQAAGIATDLQLARFLVRHGEDATGALAAAERAYAARPGIDAADTLAWAHYRLGNLEQAKRYADEATRFETRRAELLFHAGMIERALGNLEHAATLLREVQAIDPRFSVVEAPLAAAAIEAIESATAQVTR